MPGESEEEEARCLERAAAEGMMVHLWLSSTSRNVSTALLIACRARLQVFTASSPKKGNKASTAGHTKDQVVVPQEAGNSGRDQHSLRAELTSPGVFLRVQGPLNKALTWLASLMNNCKPF